MNEINNLKPQLQELSSKIDSVKDILNFNNLVSNLEKLKLDLSKIYEKDQDNFNEIANVTKQISKIEFLVSKILFFENELKFLNEILNDISVADFNKNKEIISEVCSNIEDLTLKIETFETELCFNEEDKSSCIIEIHAGSGGVDSQDWCSMLIRMYKMWSDSKNYKFNIISESYGEVGGIRDCSFSVRGDFAFGLLKNESGVHRLVRISPFNANGKRQTSFATVYCYQECDDDSNDISVNQSDLKIESFKSSGPGGQSVNTTDSAVRITHIPTGIVVKSQRQRSQFQNKKEAMRLLCSKLNNIKKIESLKEKDEIYMPREHNSFGMQIRNYVLHPYKMVKDLRSEYKTGDVFGVLDGKLNDIIKSVLKIKNQK